MSIDLTPEHRAYLERTAARISKATGTAVRGQDILCALLSLAIQDEALYATGTPGVALPVAERKIHALHARLRTVGFSDEEIRASPYLARSLPPLERPLPEPSGSR